MSELESGELEETDERDSEDSGSTPAVARLELPGQTEELPDGGSSNGSSNGRGRKKKASGRKKSARKTGRRKKQDVAEAETEDEASTAEGESGDEAVSTEPGSPEQDATEQDNVEQDTAEQDTAEQEPPALEGERLRQILEAILFASAEPISLRRLKRMLREAPKGEVEAQLLALEGHIATQARGYSLVEEGGGYRFLTRPELAPYVARLRGERKRIRLSKAAFETLAIIAYRQPIRRADLDAIRGVQSGTIVKNLMEWNLVGVAGRDDAIGRALLYETTEEFLDQFGLTTLTDLPDPAAFLELGSAAGIVETDVVAAEGEPTETTPISPAPAIDSTDAASTDAASTDAASTDAAPTDALEDEGVIGEEELDEVDFAPEDGDSPSEKSPETTD